MQGSFTSHGAPIRDAKLLPVQPPALVVGRNRELASMHVTIKAGSAVFLSGEAGVGKTALATVLSAAYIASNPGGVLWFSVVEDDFDQLVARVGRAYGVNTSTSNDNPTQAVSELLKKNRPLLVLDGLIDIDAARDFLRSCATGIPTIITNEHPGPGLWTPIALKSLSPEDSRTLFQHYANLGENDHPDDIDGLVKFIGGLPYAIELAGRIVVADELTPAELLTLLPPGTGNTGLQLMLMLVFKRLNAPVQAILVVLAAMFTGSATAELMSDLANAPAAAFVPLMRQLVARGFVHERVVYGQFAYTLHESVQGYARNWLENYQRLIPTENRALQAVQAYVERHARPALPDHDRLAAEIENIVGAAAYATETGQVNAIRKLIEAVEGRAGDFITARNFQPEAGQLNKLATLLPLPGTPAPAETAPLPDATPKTTPPSIPVQTEPAPTKPVKPPEPVITAPPPEEPASVPTLPAIPIPPPPITAETLAERLAIARAAADRKTEATVLQALGKYYVDEGQPDKAREYYKLAIDAYGAVDDFDGAQSALDAMLIIGTQTDQTEDTLRYIRRGIELAEKSGGDPSQKGRLLTRQGDLQLAKGDSRTAISSYQDAITALQDAGDSVTQGLAYSRLGDAFIANGQNPEAIEALETAAGLFHEEHFTGFEIKVLSSIGDVYTHTQQWDNAWNFHMRAHDVAVEQLDQGGEAEQLAALGHLRELQADLPKATEYYALALYTVYVYGKQDLQAKYAFELGRVLVDDTQTLTRAIALLQESDSRVPNNDARRILGRASKRLERLQGAHMAVPEARGSNRDFVTAVADRVTV
jgi:tetratricopeptide (TPR) repeat protein